MMRRNLRISLLFCLSACAAATARGAFVDVATWTQDVNTGGGSLTLFGSLAGNPVTLVTAAVPPNAGLAGFEDWANTPATNAYVTSQVQTSGNTWIAIAQGASTTESLTFGTALVNPILLLDFADPTVTYDFGSLSVTLLAAHDASLSGSVLSFPGATDSDLDGAAVQVNGTFTSFSFVAADADGRTDTQRFTVATLAAVPEPSSFILCGVGAALGMTRLYRGRRVAA